MAEDNATVVATPEQQTINAENQVGAGMWGAEPEKKAEPPVITEPAKTDAQPTKDEYEDFDEPIYLKNNYGYDSPEDLKRELEELKTLREQAKTPAQIKFANQETEKFFSYLTEEGKEDELLSHLQNKKIIAKAEKTNVENPKEATELLQTYYKFKYKDFNDDDVRDYFNDQYSKPPKPKKSDLQDEDEYNELVNDWQSRCDSIDRKIVRDAKIIKPEFSQFKTNIVLPDIQKAEAKPTQPTQEELDAANGVAKRFFEDAQSEIKKLSELSTLVKDEAVEIPVSYAYTDEERSIVLDQVKSFVENGYDTNAVFGKLWTDKNGHLDLPRMVADLAYLNSRDKITNKLANEGASQRIKAYTKDKKNINIGTGGQSSNGVVDPNKALEQVEAAIWEGRK